MHSHLIAGFLTGAALIIAIGSQNVFVLRQGLRREHVGAIVLLCAVTDTVLIVAGVAGLGQLIESLPVLLTVARLAGAAVLAWYGAQAARRALSPTAMAATDGERLSLGAALAMCAAFSWLNPHVYLDTVVLLGSLASQHGHGGRWLFGLGAACASFAWFYSLGFGARHLAPVFAKPGAWRLLDSAICLIMFGLGISMLAQI
jgi:L-lysine exporter family protein LysE/ArgO